MVSEQPTRKMVRLFLDAGWVKVRTVGSHSRWQCADGEHKFTLTDGHRIIRAGEVRKAEAAIDQCKH